MLEDVICVNVSMETNAFGSSKEDPILEQMAHLWWQLSDRERDILDEEGSTCNPNLRQPIGLTK